MVVKFTLPKDQLDGSRKMHVTFLGKTDVPSPLISLPISSVSGYEGRYMIYSIKNAVIVDVKNRTTIITIRKTGSKELQIDTHYDLPPLWLFGLGIASFLGKKPTHWFFFFYFYILLYINSCFLFRIKIFDTQKSTAYYTSNY